MKYSIESILDVEGREQPHIFSVGNDGVIIEPYKNRQLSDMLGMTVTPEDIGKTPLSEYIERWHFSETAREEVFELYMKVLDGPMGSFYLKCDCIPEECDSRQIHVNLDAERLGERIITTVRDESKIVRGKRRADELEKEFEEKILYVVGSLRHELTTPLMTIGGNAVIINRRTNDPSIERLADIQKDALGKDWPL